MTATPARIVLVPHTHWDREWYLSASRFGVRLHQVMAEVLDRLERPGDLPHFLLDGQAILLEDHLNTHPEDADRIRAHVAAGRMAIGPWYVLQDEFLVSGESTVRNLLIGDTVCAPLGGRQPVGYVPDAFGHIAQLPQLLRRAGIDTFVFTRGSGDELYDVGSEFLWTAPDGSQVLAIKQVGGYCNAGALGYETDSEAFTSRPPDPVAAVDRVVTLLDRMSPLARQDTWLLNNGCDHLPPQRDITRVVKALRDAFPATVIDVSSLATVATAVRRHAEQLASFSGELRGAAEEHLLSGTLSSRMPLKQANDRCEHLLAGILEPLTCVAHFVAGVSYPSALLHNLWKLLLANHPHDSICGCSIDLVHREMQVRFAGVADGGEEAMTQILRHLAPDDEEAHSIAVFNPRPVQYRTIVERTVVLPPETDVATLELVNHGGEPVQFAVVSTDRVRRFWGPPWRHMLSANRQRQALTSYREQHPGLFGRTEQGYDMFATIQFDVALPALGFATVALRERSAKSAPPHVPDELAVDETTLENEFVRVSLAPDGRLSIDHKASGARYEGLNRLEDVEDVGDEYDYSPCAESRSVSAIGMRGTVVVVEDTGLRATLETKFTWKLPADISADRMRRSESSVDCSVIIRVSIQRRSPLVECTLEFDNRAQDHRLRVLFPAGLTTKQLVSDGVFNVDRRPVDVPEHPTWIQSPGDAYPQREFSLVEDGSRGLVLLNRGLPEVAPYRLADGTVGMALTLLRCVGWLARDDLRTRSEAVGPVLATPDAQCPGVHEFHYALFPFAGTSTQVDVKRVSASYRAEPVVVQGLLAPAFLGSLMELVVTDGSPTAAVSAIKCHRVRDSLIARLHNWSDAPLSQRVVFGRPVDAAWLVNLLEEREAELTVHDEQALELEIAPHELLTIEVALS